MHRARSFFFVWAGVICLALICPADAPRAAAQAVDCVAAGCVPTWLYNAAAGFGPSGFQPGQTFAPQFRGELREVRIALFSSGSGTGNASAIVEIRPVVAGLPTHTVLGEATVTGAPYSRQFYSADFTGQHIALDADARYALTLRASTTEVLEVLAEEPACDSLTTGTYYIYESFDSGKTWSFWLYPRDRSFAYQVCVDAPTPVTRKTWGSLKISYR